MARLASGARGLYNRVMRSGWLGRGCVLGFFGVALLVAACGLEDKHRPAFHDDSKDIPEFSKARLGDGFDDDSASDFLTAEERQAIKRSGMTGVHVADEDDLANDEEDQQQPDAEKSPTAHALDKAGKVGVALLSVGVTLGALVAPFFAL